MLTYIDVHLIYTLSVIVVLTLITWPFISRFELFKIIFISIMAFVYTTPWDNYIIFNNAWIYSNEKILAVIGHVPLEEYMFFVIQTIMTALWTVVCTRWSPACFNFNFNQNSYRLIRWIPIMILMLVTIIGYIISIPGTQTFYLGCILWWSCPVIMFLWYGVGNYLVKKLTTSLIAILAPTLYLCWVDQIALKENVWHINEKTSLKIFLAEDLPFEECLFFLITNIIIVLGCFAFDKAYGVTDTYTIEFPCRFGLNSDYILQQYKNFAVAEYTMSLQVVSDIKQCFEVLKKASKSFNLASFVFPTGIRLDLMILYAFCRVTDDMIDNEQENKKKLKLKLITKFVDELFAGRKSDYEVETKPYIVPICWSQYESELSDEEMACFRAISRISFYMPRQPFYELIEGYKWDMEGKKVQNEDDLLLYSSYVAGSVGTLCVYIILYRTGDQKLDQKQHEYVIEKAKQMGRVLQIVNISRDIVTDSETLGRCYVPSEYMDDEDEEIKILCEKKTPWELGNKKLKKYAARMIQLANRHRAESLRGIKSLPYEARGPILVATNIYQSVATAVEDSPTYPKRASLNVWNKILVTITSLYFKTLKYCTLSKCRFNY